LGQAPISRPASSSSTAQSEQQESNVGETAQHDTAEEMDFTAENAACFAEQRKELRDALIAEAKQLYEQALALNERSSYAVNGLALFTEDRKIKRQLFEQAVELDGDNPYALANLGGELLGDDNSRALHCLNHALEVNPRLFYARLYRSKALLSMGNIDGAISSVREQLEWRPGDSHAIRFLAQLEIHRARRHGRMLLL